MLILSKLRNGGVSETDTPLLCNRLYFNILHFTLEIESGAETAAAAAAGFAGGGGEVAKEVRSGEIGFSGTVRKNNFTAQQGRRRGRGAVGKMRCFAHEGVQNPVAVGRSRAVGAGRGKWRRGWGDEGSAKRGNWFFRPRPDFDTLPEAIL